MSVVTKIARNQLFQGADTVLAFTVEPTGQVSSSWTFEFVMRQPSATCPGREDPGDGAVVLVVEDASITVAGDVVSVPIARADTVDLAPDDYFAALWRLDDGNDRPLCIIRYMHLTAVPRQS